MRRRWSWRVVAGALCAAAGSAGCGVASGEAPISGQALYGACENCHGTVGEGDRALDAPAIAGSPAWYVASELGRFQENLRGKHPDDVEGLRMRAMARQMLSQAEIDAVAAYVEALPPVAAEPTLTDVDPASGEPFYVVCSACHGPNGEGNEDLGYPPLAGLEDWYVARQMRKYQQGIRGSAPGDTLGPQMLGMALTVPAESVDAVAAYVAALPR